MGRVVVVSNRLPIAVQCDGVKLTLNETVGGLAVAVSGARTVADSTLWLGWPGDTTRCKGELRRQLEAELRRRNLRAVELSRREIATYYEGFANGILWPVLHDRIDKMPYESHDFEAYQRVNARFADACCRELGGHGAGSAGAAAVKLGAAAMHAGAAAPGDGADDGDVLWVHDFQLFMVPQYVRAKRPAARIGFFLHVPFPGPDIFAVLPWRRPLLEGLLGADLIGFHTERYLVAFLETVERVLGDAVDVDYDNDAVTLSDGRRVKVGVFPLGVDVPAFEAEANATVEHEIARWRAETGTPRMLLGVDRLDYTKGINRRLLAVERLLEIRPELRGHVSLVLVAVPTRENVEAYRDLRRQIEGHVGRINGRFTTLSGPVPVRYLSRSFNLVELIALYRAADVMVVTPTRDGMNLVAKEFVAARTDGDGVLVLSEFAGAAEELADALLVNPYDIDGTAQALARALDMPVGERRARMRSMRESIEGSSPQAWARAFLATLRRCCVPAARFGGVDGDWREPIVVDTGPAE